MTTATRFMHWSTLLVIGFALLLGTVGFFAEVFQMPPMPQELAQLIKNPLPMKKLQHLKRMNFTNKLGSFKFENTNATGELEGPWQMIEPTAIKARKDFFVKVVKSLGDIQVRNTHRTDAINLKSFSLDKPLFSFLLETTDGTSVELDFGLINPIDNSTYFTVKGQDWIYQCSGLPLPLESVTADELLDAKALAINTTLVDLIELGAYPFTGNAMQLQRTPEGWKRPAGTIVEEAKVTRFLEDLQGLKSYMVLDKLDPAQNAELLKILDAPAWKLKLGQSNFVETFYISSPLEAVGTFRLEKGRSVLFYREGSTQPLVLKADQILTITKREKELR